MSLFGDFEFKLADQISVNALLKVNANVEINAFVATHSLVDKFSLTVNLGGLGSVLNVAGAIGSHFQNQALIGRLDQLDSKINMVLESLAIIQGQVLHVEQLLNETIRRLKDLHTLELTAPARQSSHELAGLLLWVRQDWAKLQDGDGCERMRHQLRMELNNLASSDVFHLFPLFGMGIVALRDVNSFCDRPWDMKPIVSTYIEFLQRSLVAASDSDERLPMVDDSFPQLETDHKNAIDVILSPETSLIPPKWRTGPGHTKHSNANFKAKWPEKSYIFDAELDEGRLQFYSTISNLVRFSNSKPLQYVKVPDAEISITTGTNGRTEKYSGALWSMGYDYRIYGLLEVGDAGIQLARLFYHPRYIKHAFLSPTEVSPLRGILDSGALPSADDYARSMFLDAVHQDLPRTAIFPSIDSRMRFTGINAAIAQANRHFSAAAMAAEAQVAVGLLIESLESIAHN